MRHSHYKVSPIIPSLLCSRDSHPNNTYSSRDNQNGLPSIYSGGVLSKTNNFEKIIYYTILFSFSFFPNISPFCYIFVYLLVHFKHDFHIFLPI